jgi:hypothetical protein
MIGDYHAFMDLVMAHKGDQIAAENELWDHVYHGTETNQEE